MAKEITKDDVQAACDKAAAKATAAEKKRCVAAVKGALVAHVEGTSDKVFVRGAKSFATAAVAAIKAE